MVEAREYETWIRPFGRTSVSLVRGTSHALGESQGILGGAVGPIPGDVLVFQCRRERRGLGLVQEDVCSLCRMSLAAAVIPGEQFLSSLHAAMMDFAEQGGSVAVGQ